MSLLALVIDSIFGEIKRFHPLILFGRSASFVEKKLNKNNSPVSNSVGTSSIVNHLLGAVGWTVLIFPMVTLTFCYLELQSRFSYGWAFDVIILYFCIGAKSMKLHALAIYKPLSKGEISSARSACAMIVSRDTSQLSESELSRAAIESTLENTNDAIIASLFWYLVGGLPLLVCHRLANTLDAMWGYRSERFSDFGFFSAKIDDVLAWPPAKITSLLFALQGIGAQLFVAAINNARIQGNQYKSLNGGWVMAAGATVLKVKLGGSVRYHDVEHIGVQLGQGCLPSVSDIPKGIRLMEKCVYLYSLVLIAVCICLYWFGIKPEFI
ncbi:MAG: adenosylcobinamide-phosphate synthase CbiB [Kangiellaceae bacterium]|nr:adenosylcobinamide-phosphate synthase CbiB [Kangiellaceae bacterium]